MSHPIFSLPSVSPSNTHSRYIFRRAAARAISAPRQIRPVTRATSFQSSIPSIARSFHQSRSFLAEEEQKKEAESSPQQDAVSESSGTTSEPLGQSEHHSENQQSVSEQASELADKAKSTVSEAAETVAEKASYIPAQAEESFSNASENVRSAASSARQAADQFNPFQQQPAKSTTLYIGNLFFEVTAPQLESEFAKIGEVSRSRIVTDDRGLSKGFGYIQFATQEDADEAIHALHDKVFQGRRMNVQYHRRRDPNRGGAGGARNALDRAAPKDPSKTLFIGNMSYQMSDKDLNGEFPLDF